MKARRLKLPRQKYLRLGTRVTVLTAFAALAAWLSAPGAPSRSAVAGQIRIEIETEAISTFGPGAGGAPGESLRFIGGLVLRGGFADFGGLSGLRVTPDGKRLLAISDAGNWLTGTIDRGPDGHMTGIGDARFACLCGTDGKPYPSKHWADAEGLEIDGSRAYVSFERLQRINAYDLGSDHLPGKPVQATASFKPFGLAYNEGLEALALAPAGLPEGGRFIAIAERSLDGDGNHRAFIASKDDIREFAITRSDDYDVTDAVFLDDGRLLVLERRFGLTIGIGMRIRAFDGKTITPGALLDGETLIEAGLTSRIDNMEGLAAWRTPDGRTRLIILSDDNFRAYQQTLLLEFELEG